MSNSTHRDKEPAGRSAGATAAHGELLFDIGVAIGFKLKALIEADPTIAPQQRSIAIKSGWHSIRFGAASALLPSVIGQPGAEDALQAVFDAGAQEAIRTYNQVGRERFAAAMSLAQQASVLKDDASPAQGPFLPIGTLITTIHGEINSMDRGEVSTGPMAEGFVEAVFADQESCYAIVFPKSGACIILTKNEVADSGQYIVGRQLFDNEVLGVDGGSDSVSPDVVQWDAQKKQAYVSSQTLEQYGVHNLHEHELARVDVSLDAWRKARAEHAALASQDA